tara:strand:- start:178 stop:303 length:126 start_codon:yes stop_codon:yes gene_type:complete
LDAPTVAITGRLTVAVTGRLVAAAFFLRMSLSGFFFATFDG